MIKTVSFEDLKEILSLQKLAYKSEAEIYNDDSIPPLTQTLDGIEEDYNNQTILKAVIDDKIVGSVRAYEKDGTCYIGRLIVHQEYQNQGIGKSLMNNIEECFSECKKYSLFTGKKSEKNLYLYERLGYKKVKEEFVNEELIFVFLEKDNVVFTI